jgi:uncharacterized protein (TIGR00725 family)
MKKIIGVMGPNEAAVKDLKNAYEIGKFCAENGYVTLTGGTKRGVMNEALRGAKEHGGLTVGITFTKDKAMFSKYIDIPIITTMGTGRNILNVWSSDVVVACGMRPGTSSEVSLAIKEGKKVILVGLFEEAIAFYEKLAPEQIYVVEDYNEAIRVIEEII